MQEATDKRFRRWQMSITVASRYVPLQSPLTPSSFQIPITSLKVKSWSHWVLIQNSSYHLNKNNDVHFRHLLDTCWRPDVEISHSHEWYVGGNGHGLWPVHSKNVTILSLSQSQCCCNVWRKSLRALMRHCDRTVEKKTPLGSRPLVRGSKSLTGGPGEAVVIISGRERITDQVMTLQNELNFILSSASDHQEQEAFYWRELTSSAVSSD